MNYESLAKTLGEMNPFKAEHFELFVQKLSVVHLKKNEIWEHEGKLSNMMGFVNSGVLRVYYLKDGDEFTTDFHMENEFVGNYISFQSNEPSATSTQAIEACELLVIPFAEFEKLKSLIPNAEETSKMVGDQKLSSLYKRNLSLLMDTPEERYYKLVEQKPNLVNRVPQYLIAQYLGIRPESLSRIRKRHIS